MSVNLQPIPTTDLFFHTVMINEKRYFIPLYLNFIDCKARLDMLLRYKYAKPNEKETITIEEINNNISNQELFKKEDLSSTEINNYIDDTDLNKIIKERSILVDKMVTLINGIDSSLRQGLINELATYANSEDISLKNKNFVKIIIFKLTQEEIFKNDDLNTYDIVYIYQLKYILAVIQILALAKEKRQPAIKALSSAEIIPLSEKTQIFFDKLDSYRIKEEKLRIGLSKESKGEKAETEEKRKEEEEEEVLKILSEKKKTKEPDPQAEKLREYRNELIISKYKSNYSTEQAYEQLKKKDLDNISPKRPTYKIEKAFDPLNSNESNIDIITINLPATCAYEINMNDNLVKEPQKINIIKVIKTGEAKYKKNNESNLYTLDLIASFVEFIINDKLNQNTFTYTVNKDTDTKIVKALSLLSKMICKAEGINYEVIENENFNFVYNWE